MKCLYKKIAMLLIVILMIGNTVNTYAATPNLESKSVLVLEQSTQSVIYEKSADDKMYPASTTKMLTALVTLDYFDFDNVIKVGKEIELVPENSSVAGVSVGDVLTIENALNGLLLASGNELACVLAWNTVKKIEGNTVISYEEAEKKFAVLMNKKAQELGTTASNFVNPHGYHDDNHYTTARDLSKIAIGFMKNEKLAEIVSKVKFSGYGADPEKNSGIIRQYNWTNSNRLISSILYGYEYATGIKTGYTDEAGRCLVASAKKDGVTVIAILLYASEEGRWKDAQVIFDWAFDSCSFVQLHTKDSLLGEEVSVLDGSFEPQKKIKVIAEEDLSGYIYNEGYKIDSKIVYNEEVLSSVANQPPMLKLPIKQGQELGKIYYYSGEKLIAQGTISAAEDAKINLLDNLDIYINAVKQIKKDQMMKIILKMVIGALILCAIILIIIRLRWSAKKRKRRNSRLMYR